MNADSLIPALPGKSKRGIAWSGTGNRKQQNENLLQMQKYIGKNFKYI